MNRRQRKIFSRLTPLLFALIVSALAVRLLAAGGDGQARFSWSPHPDGIEVTLSNLGTGDLIYQTLSFDEIRPEAVHFRLVNLDGELIGPRFICGTGLIKGKSTLGAGKSITRTLYIPQHHPRRASEDFPVVIELTTFKGFEKVVVRSSIFNFSETDDSPNPENHVDSL